MAHRHNAKDTEKGELKTHVEQIEGLPEKNEEGGGAKGSKEVTVPLKEPRDQINSDHHSGPDGGDRISGNHHVGQDQGDGQGGRQGIRCQEVGGPRPKPTREASGEALEEAEEEKCHKAHVEAGDGHQVSCAGAIERILDLPGDRPPLPEEQAVLQGGIR